MKGIITKKVADFIRDNGIRNMRIQTFNEITVGSINYLTENVGDAPISVYVIRGDNGDMLVDTGLSTTYKHILKWLETNNFNITDIFITHAHPDHDWNAQRLKEKYNARIWIAEKDMSLIRNFSLQRQFPTDKKYAFRVKWISLWTKTPFFKSKAYTPDIIITKEGSELPNEYGYDFSIVFLPGHTMGSMGILTKDTLYCGDSYAVINGQPMVPPHANNVELMHESISKIRTINPKYLACGHGVPYLFD